MKLFIIERTDNPRAYDIYLGAVVVAANAEEARAMHPDGREPITYETWTSPENVSVKYIGEAAVGLTGVILADFLSG